jgi:hypothetical protein
MAREVYFVPGYADSILDEVLAVTAYALSGAQNDLALIVNAGDTIFDLTPAAALNITGIVAPAAGTEKVIVLRNKGAVTITLKHADAGSAAANRLTCPGAADASLLRGGEVALVYNDATNTWDVGALVPRSGFKLAVNKAANAGAIVLLDKRWWTVKHMAFESDGSTAVTDALYLAHGLTIPTASYAADTAAKRASKQIAASEEALVQIKRGEQAIWFLAGSGVTTNLVANFRPNEGGYGLNR